VRTPHVLLMQEGLSPQQRKDKRALSDIQRLVIDRGATIRSVSKHELNMLAGNRCAAVSFQRKCMLNMGVCQQARAQHAHHARRKQVCSNQSINYTLFSERVLAENRCAAVCHQAV
jgi:hypothetical protein